MNHMVLTKECFVTAGESNPALHKIFLLSFGKYFSFPNVIPAISYVMIFSISLETARIFFCIGYFRFSVLRMRVSFTCPLGYNSNVSFYITIDTKSNLPVVHGYTYT